MANNSPELSVTELISTIARGVVDRPEEVSLTATTSQAGTHLQLRVDPSDMHTIIGKQGRLARALHILLRAVSVKRKNPYSLDIVQHTRQDAKNK